MAEQNSVGKELEGGRDKQAVAEFKKQEQKGGQVARTDAMLWNALKTDGIGRCQAGSDGLHMDCGWPSIPVSPVRSTFPATSSRRWVICHH